MPTDCQNIHFAKNAFLVDFALTQKLFLSGGNFVESCQNKARDIVKSLPKLQVLSSTQLCNAVLALLQHEAQAGSLQKVAAFVAIERQKLLKLLVGDHDGGGV